MNWIQFHNKQKIEVIEGFKSTGPLKGKQRENMWSNFHFYSLKIRVPSDFDISFLRGTWNTYYKNNKGYYDAHFEIINVRGLSTGTKFKTYKIEVEGVLLNELPLQIERDLRISDLIEDEN